MRSFRLGTLHVGVRTNASDFDAALTAALQDYAVDDTKVPPNYSVVLEPSFQSRSRPRYQIFVGCKQATTTRSLDRAVGIVCGYMEDHLSRPQLDEGHVELAAVSLVHGREALLAPWQMRHGAPLLEARLERHDIQILEHRSAVIDVGSSAVVVGPPLLPSTPLVRGRRDQDGFRARVPEGHYRLRGWLVWEGWRWGKVTPGIATAYGMTIAHQHGSPEQTLESLSRFVTAVTLRPIRSVDEVAQIASECWA
jgi:hypothetical protein